MLPLRIPQAASAVPVVDCRTRTACGIRKKAQPGLTEGLGTAFPQKGVPNISTHSDGGAGGFAAAEGGQVAAVVGHRNVILDIDFPGV